MHFTLSAQSEGDTTTIFLTGQVERLEADACLAELLKLVDEGGPTIHLNLKDLRRIDGFGVGVIRSFCKHVEILGKKCRIVDLCDQPRALFRILRLDTVLPCGN